MVIRPPLKKWIFGWSNDHDFYGKYLYVKNNFNIKFFKNIYKTDFKFLL